MVGHGKKCWNACQVATEFSGYGEFNLPYDLNSHRKCFSELPTWGKKREEFAHLHPSPIFKFSAFPVCTSMNTKMVPTGSPGQEARGTTSVGAQGKAPSGCTCRKLVKLAYLVTVERETDSRGFRVNIREVHFQGLLPLPVLFFTPYFC